ncbi:MAG: sigma-70 family RNA polymerase sigma factor [Bacteroidetes bacterium]|nr:sigma-70 family RNA polymerase sigma factor [Bacteroidota bacterium]
MDDTTDLLMYRFSKGDEKAFDALFRQHYKTLYFFADSFGLEKMEKEDIVEEAFVKAWTQRENFTNVKAFRSFLYVVVRNSALNVIRSNTRKKNTLKEFALMGADHEADFSEKIMKAEMIREILQEIEQLPPLYKEVIELSYLKQLNAKQIAEQLGRPVQTIRVQHLRGLSLLRKQLPHFLFLLFLLRIWQQVTDPQNGQDIKYSTRQLNTFPQILKAKAYSNN